MGRHVELMDESEPGRSGFRPNTHGTEAALPHCNSTWEKLQLTRPSPFGGGVLCAVALLAPACMHAVTNEEAHPVAPAAALAASASPAPPLTASSKLTAAPSPVGVAWNVQARPERVPEFQGKSVTLPKGVRCTVFRGLPSLTYTTSTLIKDACLRIPSGTTIEVHNGATLAIVATTELFIGKNVTFDGKGSRGRRGERAEFATFSYVAATDAEIQTLCVAHGNRCPCPTDGDAIATMRGKAGGGGTPGGSVHLIAGSLGSPSGLAGLRIDTSGGLGGPPGDSATRQCERGELRCSSEVCSAGAASGATGPRGVVFLSMGGTVAAAARERVTAALGTLAPEDAIALGPGTDVAAQVAELDALAIQQGWERRSGDELE